MTQGFRGKPTITPVSPEPDGDFKVSFGDGREKKLKATFKRISGRTRGEDGKAKGEVRGW